MSDAPAAMSSSFRVLTADERDAIVRRLEPALLRGVAATTADPFVADATVVVEESGRGLDRLGAGLARLLAETSATTWYAVRYDVDGGKLRWSDAYELTVAPGGPDFDAAGQDVGFLINGIDFVLTDETARWALMTTLDVILVGGPPALVRAYYGDDAAIAEARAALADFLATPGMRPEYTRLLTFQRD
jgi:hypothetical protein